MILKLQHVSVFLVKPSSGSRFVPKKFTFFLYIFLSMLAACLEINHNLLGISRHAANILKKI